MVQFLLSHVAVGPDARRLDDLLFAAGALPPLQPCGGEERGPAATAAAAAAAPIPRYDPAVSAEAAGVLSSAVAVAGMGAGGDATALLGTVCAMWRAAGAAGQPVPSAASSSSTSSSAAAAAAAAISSGIEARDFSEHVNKALILAPLVGALVGLERAAEAGGGGSSGGGVGGGSESAKSSSSSGLVSLLAAAPGFERLLEGLAFATDRVAWHETFVCTGQTMKVELDALRAVMAATSAERERRTQGGAGGGGGPGAGDSGAYAAVEDDATFLQSLSPEEESALPSDLLDPITMAPMADPVELPDSRVTVDRSTVERHLLGAAGAPGGGGAGGGGGGGGPGIGADGPTSVGMGTDPFSRAPLTLGMVRSNRELRARVAAWVAERREMRKAGVGGGGGEEAMA